MDKRVAALTLFSDGLAISQSLVPRANNEVAR